MVPSLPQGAGCSRGLRPDGCPARMPSTLLPQHPCTGQRSLATSRRSRGQRRRPTASQRISSTTGFLRLIPHCCEPSAASAEFPKTDARSRMASLPGPMSMPSGRSARKRGPWARPSVPPIPCTMKEPPIHLSTGCAGRSGLDPGVSTGTKQGAACRGPAMRKPASCILARLDAGPAGKSSPDGSRAARPVQYRRDRSCRLIHAGTCGPRPAATERFRQQFAWVSVSTVHDGAVFRLFDGRCEMSFGQRCRSKSFRSFAPGGRGLTTLGSLRASRSAASSPALSASQAKTMRPGFQSSIQSGSVLAWWRHCAESGISRAHGTGKQNGHLHCWQHDTCLVAKGPPEYGTS